MGTLRVPNPLTIFPGINQLMHEKYLTYCLRYNECSHVTAVNVIIIITTTIIICNLLEGRNYGSQMFLQDRSWVATYTLIILYGYHGAWRWNTYRVKTCHQGRNTLTLNSKVLNWQYEKSMRSRTNCKKCFKSECPQAWTAPGKGISLQKYLWILLFELIKPLLLAIPLKRNSGRFSLELISWYLELISRARNSLSWEVRNERL